MKNKSNYVAAEKINAALRAMRPQDRPEMPTRARAVRVDYAACGHMEVTAADGSLHYVPVATAMRWVK